MFALPATAQWGETSQHALLRVGSVHFLIVSRYYRIALPGDIGELRDVGTANRAARGPMTGALARIIT
jgi:hypothetical protein